MTTLPADATTRKKIPLTTGCLDYFPHALAAVAEVSRVANDQHNPGEPMHWARGKSTDHADCITRHMVDRGTLDTDGLRHTAKLAWRALALLEEELEAAGAKPGRASRFPDEATTKKRRMFGTPFRPSGETPPDYSAYRHETGPSGRDVYGCEHDEDEWCVFGSPGNECWEVQ